MKSTGLALILGSILLSSCAENPPRTKTYTPHEEQKSAPLISKDDAIKNTQTLYQKGDYANALAHLDAIHEDQLRANDRAEYWNLRGLILLAQKKPLQSETSFRKALNDNRVPEYNSYYQYNIATAQMDAARPAEALKTLDQIKLQNLDTTQQHKILSLKEKLGSELNSVPAPDSKVTPGASPKTLSSDAGTAVVVMPTPTEIFHGDVVKTRIGLLLPLSGKYESFGKKAQRAIELAFQHSGDDRAKTYELVPVDSGDTPESQLEGLKKLIEVEKVIAVIGPILSKGIEGLSANAAYYQVALLSIAQSQGPVNSHLFSCSISTRDQASRIVEYAMKTKGYSKFAILAPSNKSGEEMANAFWDEVEFRNGEIKEFELYDPNDTDFRKPVDRTLGLFYTEARAKELEELAAKRSEMNITRKTMKTAQYYTLPPIIDFDAVFIADEAKTVGQIIPTFAYRDAKKISFLGTSAWNSSQLIQRAQDNVEGAVFPVGFNTLSPSASSLQFTDLYKSTYSANPAELEAIAFDSAELVIKTLSQAPSNRDEFTKKLETISAVDGATGSVAIQNHRCARKLTLYSVQSGKLVALPDENN